MTSAIGVLLGLAFAGAGIGALCNAEYLAAAICGGGVVVIVIELTGWAR